MQTFPTGGVALRPGFIYGTRQVGAFGIPLQAVGGYLRSALERCSSRTYISELRSSAVCTMPVSRP